MSKRRDMFNGGSIMTAFMMLAVMLAFSGLFNPASAQYGLDYQVKFGVRDAPIEPGNPFILDLWFWDPDSSFQAQEFYLQVWYPDSVVSPVYTIASELLVNCGWSLEVEYPSSGLIKLHGKAPEGADSLDSECLLHGIGDPLASIYMQAANDSSYRCNFFPLRFYWDNCADNIFISPGGDSAFMSDGVWDEGYVQPYQLDDTLPTFHGAPDICFNDTIMGAIPVRKMNFIEGGVFIACNPLYHRGDLNMNHIANELADYILYANYFLYGLEVFTINPDWQIALSDINANGIVLMPDDMVYMNRVIIGDAMPYDKDYDFPWSDTAFFVQDLVEKKISLTSPDSLGAISLTFDGEIVPQESNTNGLQMSYSHVDGKTHILIYPYGQDRILYAGDMFSYTGYGLLTKGEAGDCEGLYPYGGDITINGEIPICGDADGNGVLNITDAIRIINCVFFSGAPCPTLQQGDTNCNGVIEIGDAVWMIYYIFMGGNAPCDTNGDGARDC